MNIIVELPKETILVVRDDLKAVLKELLLEHQMANQGDPVLTIKETAALLKVSIPTVRNLISNQEIPYFQRGQVIRFNRTDVLEWMRSNTS